MGTNLTTRRVIAVLLLVVAILMILWHLLPAFGWLGASFPRVVNLLFAGIALVGAWILWRGWGDSVEESHGASQALAGASAGAMAHAAFADGHETGEAADETRDAAEWAALVARAEQAEAEASTLRASRDADASSRSDADAELTELRAKLEMQSADVADKEAQIAQLKAEIDALDVTAEESADLASDGDSATSAWSSRREFAGKSQDDLNEMFGGGFVDGALCRHLKIDYTDSKGQESEREILVYAMVYRRGYINLDSFPTDAATCLTFRADRIRKLEDLQNGDVVTEDIEAYLLDGRPKPQTADA